MKDATIDFTGKSRGQAAKELLLRGFTQKDRDTILKYYDRMMEKERQEV